MIGWPYRRDFLIDGERYTMLAIVGLTRWRSRLLHQGRVLAEDASVYVGAQADYRNHHLSHRLPDGSRLEIESGYISWWSIGIAVRRDGARVHESHPGRQIIWPTLAGRSPQAATDPQQVQAQAQRDREQWARNKPSLIVDIALALLFFVVAKLTDNLTTAALVGAGAGLAVVAVQPFVKADLLGGLALFGVFTLLLSAGFSLVFQDERMVQLKGTILGSLIALLILGDAVFNRGRYFGARMARYIMGFALDQRRLALGLGLLGLIMAGTNLLVTQVLSRDVWLFYTTFLDAPLSVLLGFAVLRYARARG